MLVKRTMKVDVELFKVGDVIKFKLTDGEKVKAMAVKEISEGMLFVLVDCLAKEYPMFNNIDDMDEEDISYINSDLSDHSQNEASEVKNPFESKSGKASRKGSDKKEKPKEAEKLRAEAGTQPPDEIPETPFR